MTGSRAQRLRRWLPIGIALALAALGAFAWSLRKSVSNQADRPFAQVPLLAPKATTIAPGIHMLGGLQPSAVYVVETSEGLVLIDSGEDSNARDLKTEMAALGLDWREIRAILITHAHGDHSGGAEHLRAATGAKIFAGAADAEVLKAGGPREALFSIFYRPGYQPHHTTIDVELSGGEALDFGDVHFRALGTPGHTPGSICYLLERGAMRVLFSGDVIMMLRGDEKPSSQVRKPLGTYSAYLAPHFRGEPAAFLSTLRALRDLSVPDLVLPGHPSADPAPESPQLSQKRWESLLDGGINEMRVLIDRLAKDGSNFLGGQPKRLLPELYYLGNFEGASVYGFSAASKFFLIDAPGGPGLLAWVRSRLKQLGAEAADPSAVLLTSCGPESTAGLKEMLTQAHSSVVTRSAGLDVIRGLCPPETSLIAAQELPVRGPIPVRVVPLRGRGIAPVAYSVTLNGKTVLFSGRIPIQSKTEIERALVAELSSSRGTAIDYLIAVNQLSAVKPDLWLPATSADDQNANIYDAEWENLINFNYRVGFHCARGLGLLAPRGAPSSAAAGPMDDDCLRLAREFTGGLVEPESLRGLHEILGIRGRVGLAVLRAELDSLRELPRSHAESPERAGELLRQIGSLELNEGRFAEAAVSLRGSIESISALSSSATDRADLTVLLLIAAIMRCGLDKANAVLQGAAETPPHEPDAAEAGLREAVAQLTHLLESQPDDLRLRWLLNLAFMTLGEYPLRVPPDSLISIASSRVNRQAVRFENIAAKAGLGNRGPTMAGGSLFDDFNGDGLPDLLISSLDTDRGASLYINQGDGTFADRSQHARLGDQIAAIRASAADYDNDGDLDVVLVRGAGETPMRLSLLRNDGKGVFEDVTVSARLSDPIAAASASWGDFDHDGFVDLYVCGEYLTDSRDPNIVLLDPRNCSRLYHNRRDGTFQNVAQELGVAGEHRAVDSTWGDFDGDGRPDLFVSSWDGPCRLYNNGADGRFHEVAAERGVAGPPGHHASACFFWDFDNDGRLDLLVGDGDSTIADMVAHQLGHPPRGDCHPRLYRNAGAAGFKDVSREVGLDWPIPALAANFGDVDNDGFLDVYFGGALKGDLMPAPNVLLLNRGGKRFDDVTESSGTRRLQSGHSISFADANGDGSLDFVVTSGRASPGSREDHLLFQNLPPARRWLAIKLVGTKSNRKALGAKIHVELKDAGGALRSIDRTVGSVSASGGSSPVETIGLGDAASVDRLVVTWPTSRTSQTFRDIAAGQLIEVTEGAGLLQRKTGQGAGRH
jgi:glyoxylase-like metal-dependent hydrolase (beta-lactamase superfamily II)